MSSPPYTWNNTIKGLFRQKDIDHMNDPNYVGEGNTIDLSSYDQVKQYASTGPNGSSGIYEMVSTQQMPPDTPWDTGTVDKFKWWMDNGFPET